MDLSVRRASGADVLAAARKLAAAIAAGALAGFAIGGVGGRVAMLVLRLTSDPQLHGLQTDDDFTIGIVSGSTIFLLGVTTVIGTLGGVAYLLARPWLPERIRPWIWGALGALFGGANIVRPGGIDFTLLDPLPLAVAMFVAIPAAGAVATSLLAERFLRPESRFHRSWLALGLLAFLLLPVAASGLQTGGPLGFLAVVPLGAVLIWFGAASLLARAWRSTPVVWLGRAALVAVAVRATVELVRDARTIL